MMLSAMHIPGGHDEDDPGIALRAHTTLRVYRKARRHEIPSQWNSPGVSVAWHHSRIAFGALGSRHVGAVLLLGRQLVLLRGRLGHRPQKHVPPIVAILRKWGKVSGLRLKPGKCATFPIWGREGAQCSLGVLHISASKLG